MNNTSDKVNVKRKNVNFMESFHSSKKQKANYLH